jgi:hypothetical protein
MLQISFVRSAASFYFNTVNDTLISGKMEDVLIIIAIYFGVESSA